MSRLNRLLVMSIMMDAFFVSILAWCGYSDMKRRTVSNVSIALLVCLGIPHMAVVILTNKPWWPYPASLLLAVPFFIAWLRNNMGAGDVKLVLSISLYLGLMNTLVSFALMVPVLAVLMVRSRFRHKTMKCRIPLAPVIGIGAVGAVILGHVFELVYR